MSSKKNWFELLMIVIVCAFMGAVIGNWNQRRPERVIENFHRLYFESLVEYNDTWWLGVQVQKCPLDAWTYQEILYETRPDVIVETGTFKGGSAYYLACVMDLLKHGRIITVDIEENPERPKHDRITYITGSSVDAKTVSRVKKLIAPGEKVMAVLDSVHTAKHVISELELYAPLVTVGQYLVVEDTHFNGHPITPGRFVRGPGAWEAVQKFKRSHGHFVSDLRRERFKLTFFPNGWLKRTK